MEVFFCIAFEPPLGFHSDSVAQMTCNPFGVSLSLGVRGAALATFHVPIVELYFPNVAWSSIKSIIRLIRFSL